MYAVETIQNRRGNVITRKSKAANNFSCENKRTCTSKSDKFEKIKYDFHDQERVAIDRSFYKTDTFIQLGKYFPDMCKLPALSPLHTDIFTIPTQHPTLFSTNNPAHNVRVRIQLGTSYISR